VNGEIGDMVKAGVVEAYEVKRNVILGASEIACMLVRVDDAIPKKIDYDLIEEMRQREELAKQLNQINKTKKGDDKKPVSSKEVL
jgi:hypothetical protein